MNAPSTAGALRPLRDDMFFADEHGAPVALLGKRCLDCERVFFPPRAICSHCALDGRLVPHRMSSQGVIHASTVARVPSAMGHAAPYAYGYVDLPTDGVRIFAPFSGAPVESFVPGLKVRLALGEIPAESLQGVLGYSFVRDIEATHG